MINPVQFEQFDIPYHAVLSRLGYLTGKTRLDAQIQKSIEDEIILAKKIISPKRVLSVSTIQFSSSNEVALDPDLLIQSKDIYELLTGCVKAYGFAVTIGNSLEQKRDQYIKEKNTAKALLLDAIGSVAAEELAEITNSFLAEEVRRKKLILTRRFSPGYGDWSIAGQKDFIRWLGGKDIGITVNDKYQMIPEKSVSALVGVKPR